MENAEITKEYVKLLNAVKIVSRLVLNIDIDSFIGIAVFIDALAKECICDVDSFLEKVRYDNFKEKVKEFLSSYANKNNNAAKIAKQLNDIL